MFFSVDRITAGRAMLIGEDRKPLEVPVQMLPAGAKEGDMLRYQDGAFSPAPHKTAERRARVAEMLGMLLKDDGPESEQPEPQEQPGPAEPEGDANGETAGDTKEE